MIDEWWSYQSPRARRVWLILALGLAIGVLWAAGGDPAFPLDR